MDSKPITKHIEDLNEIIAGDKCFLRELFHPDRDKIKTNFSLAYAHIKPGGKSVEHFLDKQSETYYIISGYGTMFIDGMSFKVKAGNSYYIPAGCRQWLVNEGDAIIDFLVIVDPPWRKEDEIII